MVDSLPKIDGKEESTVTSDERNVALTTQLNSAAGNTTTTLTPAEATTTSSSNISTTNRVPQHRQVALIAPALPMANQLMGGSQMQVQFTIPMQQANNFYRTSMTSTAVFHDRKLRSGKWTNEEEEYAELLIELFEKGLIDEKNGCTLRSFLSRKLHCAPMRISKKYAGKGIGKMVFLSKSQFTPIDPNVYRANLARLQDAEIKFLKVVYPELSLQPPAIPPCHPPPQPANFSLIPLVPAPPNGPSHIQMQPNLNQAAGQAGYHPWANQPQAVETPMRRLLQDLPSAGAPQRPHQNAYGSAVLVPNSGHHQLATPDGLHSGNSSLQFSSSSSNAQTLHQAYLKVVQSQNSGSTAAKAQSIPQPAATPVANNSLASQQTHTLQQSYLSAAGGGEARLAPKHPETNSGESGRASHGNGETRAGTLSPKDENPITKAASTTVPSEMPDFLSGFDKVTGRKSNQQGHAVDATVPHTPTYTSKSFDDFHRLLGKNLSPMSLNKNAVTGQKIPGPPSLPDQRSIDTKASGSTRLSPKPTPMAQPLNHHVWSAPNPAPAVPAPPAPAPEEERKPDIETSSHLLAQAFKEALSAASTTTAPSHMADFYNIFAQQSAFAASQHSAYMGGRKVQEQEESSSSPSHQVEQTHVTSSLRPMHNPNVVSEPSATSDQGTEESDESPGEISGASGTESQGSNGAIDSDGTNSEGSMSRKKARISYNVSSKRNQKVPNGHGSSMD